MNIEKHRVRALIKDSLLRILMEGLEDKIAAETGLENTVHIENIRILSGKPYRLNKPELLWLARYYLSPTGMKDEEPAEDIGKTMRAFLMLTKRPGVLSGYNLSSKFDDYKSPNELRMAIARTEGRVVSSDLQRETTVIGEYGPWTVYMPHTREASCELGADTVWCTTITGRGNNLFYNYVAKSEGAIILYYVIYDPTKDQSNRPPEAKYRKMSLGFAQNKIYWPDEHNVSGYGGITVNAENGGLTKAKFLGTAGANGLKMINDINTHGSKLKGVHPAIPKIISVAGSLNEFKREIRGKSADAILDTAKLIGDSVPPEELDDEVLIFLGEKLEKLIPGAIEKIAENHKNIIESALADESYWRSYINVSMIMADLDAFDYSQQAGDDTVRGFISVYFDYLAQEVYGSAGRYNWEGEGEKEEINVNVYNNEGLELNYRGDYNRKVSNAANREASNYYYSRTSRDEPGVEIYLNANDYYVELEDQ